MANYVAIFSIFLKNSILTPNEHGNVANHSVKSLNPLKVATRKGINVQNPQIFNTKCNRVEYKAGLYRTSMQIFSELVRQVIGQEAGWPSNWFRH